MVILQKINVSRKYRIYPNEQQITIIENTFNMVRFTWNKMLEKAKDSYFNPEETFNIVNYSDIVHEYPFLDKSNKDFVFDRHAVHNERSFLFKSFKLFFDKFKKKMEFTKKGKPKHFPKFKSKKYSKNSYTNYNAKMQCKIDICSYMIKIPCLGWVKYSMREKPIPDNWKVNSVTISRSYSNKYYCSICFEYEDDRIGISCNLQDFIMSNPNRNIYVLGLDYSSSSLYIDSNGDSAEYPKYYRNNQKRLRILNKQLSRQQKGSKHYEETLSKLRDLHEHISNCRKDFLHKLSTSITKMYDVISVEDINMQQIGMRKGKFKLGKSTMDNAFGMFRDMLEYKQQRIPYHLLYVNNKWYPSSKTCSRCGYIKLDLELKDRTYRCPQCGFTIDRDINAALNLKNNALKTLNENLSKRYQFISI